MQNFLKPNFALLIFCLIGMFIINGCGPSKEASLKLTDHYELPFMVNSGYESAYEKAIELARRKIGYEVGSEIDHGAQKGLVKCNIKWPFWDGVVFAIEIYGKEENKSFVVIYYWIGTWDRIAHDFKKAMME
jgi:hypothetical protein